MKRKWQYIVAGFVFLILIMACGLPVTITSKVPNQEPSPNVDLTAIKILETMLTPAPTSEQATETPVPTATQVVLTNTPVPSNTAVPSNTPTQTATSLPVYVAPTSAYYPVRYSGTFYAMRFWNPPTLDGNWDDWDGAMIYGANSVVYGMNKWYGEADLNSSFRVGWDNNYLYIAAKVKDDQYAQHATGQDLYLGDSLEILFDNDLYNDFYTTALNEDDYQLGISPGLGNIFGPKEAFLWFPKSSGGLRPDVKIASRLYDDGYRVEVAIPWYTFAMAPAAGQHLGFVFSASDDDAVNMNVQQSMVSSSSARRLTNPTTWNELILGN
jgi:hypothetical protein